MQSIGINENILKNNIKNIGKHLSVEEEITYLKMPLLFIKK